MTRFNLGFVGCGFVAQQCHLPCYAANDNFKITCLADPIVDLRENIAQMYGIKQQFNSHLELLDKRDIDAVVVTLPRRLSFKVVYDLVSNGFNVITEKPLCLNYLNALQLVEAQKKSGNILMTGYMKQHDKGVKEFKNIVNSINKSEINSIRAYCHMGNSYASPFGDKKGKIISNTEDAVLEEMPDWLPANMYWEYEQFINVFSHITHLLECIFREKLKLNSQLINTKGEGLILAKLGSMPVCLDLMRGIQYQWHEGIEINTRSTRIKLNLPAAFLRNQPATVELSEGDTSHIKSYKVADWSWAFREQSFAFEKALSNQYDYIKDLDLASSQIKFAEDVFKEIIRNND